MDNKFESFGEHIRNILTPYSTLIQILEDITAPGATSKQKNTLIQYLLDTDHINAYKDNLKHFIDFSKLDEIESLNWRNTSLFQIYKNSED
jgi:hypothetical protein